MRMLVLLLTAALLVSPVTVQAQDGRAALDAVAKALGADTLKSIEIQGAGVMYQVGQSAIPGQEWPLFNVRTLTRSVNFETASLRDDMMRTRAFEPPKGGGVYIRGEHRQIAVVSGDQAWNVAGETATTAPVALAERQFQLWSTPHGVVKAALAGKGSIQGRTITFGQPGRFKATAFLNAANMVERVEGVIANPVQGDMAVTVTYADYRDFGGVKFPTKIRQTQGGFPSLDLMVTEIKPNATVDVAVPDAVRQATNPYTRVTSQSVAEGVWYLTGGSHHSVVVEMKDHLVVVESPLNDERALAVLAETKKLSPKPIKYLVVSHHHYDHAGGVRAFAGEGATIVVHELGKSYFERMLAQAATVNPDHLAKSGKRATVEGVRGTRVLTDGARNVEIRHIAGSAHADDMLLVYLPKEKFLIEADAYTPPAPNAQPMTPPSIFTVNLVENITKQGLAVDQILPLHGRMVPVAELHKAAGH